MLTIGGIFYTLRKAGNEVSASAILAQKDTSSLDLINLQKEPSIIATPSFSMHEEEDSITPESAALLMADARAIPHSFARAAACIKIIERLCRAGYTEEAWMLIDDNPGTARYSEINKFFLTAGLGVQEFVDKIRNLPFKREPGMALEGYLSSLDGQKIRALLQDESFKNIISELNTDNPGILKRAIATSLMGKVAFPGEESEKKAAMTLAVEYHKEGLIDDNGLAQVLKSDRFKSSFEKWELLTDSVKVAPSSSRVAELRKELVEDMVNADAQKALIQISEREGVLGSSDLFMALKKWGLIDSAAANSWLVEHRTRLNDTQQDAAAHAFFQLALSYGEPDGAEQWARQIKDEKLRNAALAKLTKEETEPSGSKEP